MGQNTKKFRKKISKFFRFFGRGAREFCEHTPIHGVSYVGQGGRTLKERVIWIIILAFAASLCFYLIRNRYIKWKETPILVNFKEDPLNVWDIPFPAVTICPEGLGYTNESLNRLFNSECISTIQLAASLTCYEDIDLGYYFNETDTCSARKALKEAISTLLLTNQDISFKYDSTSRSVDTFLTEVGICHTFNLYDPSDIFTDEVDTDLIVPRKANVSRNTEWTLSKGYKNRDVPFPFRVYSSGIKDAVTVAIGESFNMSPCDTSPFEEHSVFLHSPLEYPWISKQPISFVPKRASFVAVKPRVVFAGEDVFSLPVERRKCYFENENPLRFFHFYTESNCNVECLTNYTLKNCQCVPAYLPRAKDMKLCTTGKDMRCARDASKSMFTYEFTNKGNPGSCNCLTDCNSIIFDYSVSHTSPDLESLHEIFPDIENNVSAVIMIFQSDPLIWTRRRSRFATLIGFLGDCGGVMGLCMGVSIVSIIEIIYHCVIRCGCRAHKKPKTQPKEQNDMIRASTQTPTIKLHVKPERKGKSSAKGGDMSTKNMLKGKP